MSVVTLDHVRAALALTDFDVPAAQRQMAPAKRTLRRDGPPTSDSRRASVLILLFPGTHGLSFALIKRTQNPNDRHSGQISLPGGSAEAGETVIETALRETREELGVAAPVDIIGQLTCLYIPHSDFKVRPVVGYIAARPVWVPDPAEVSDVIECPLDWLLDPARKVVEDWVIAGYTVRVPWYDIHGHQVWGATAIMLSEFEQRLHAVFTPPKS